MRGWTPWDFQRRAWSAFGEGRSGLIQVATGSGKTYAAYMGPLASLMDSTTALEPKPRIIYVTPLRSVARDIEQALLSPIREMKLSFVVESRTGDTSATVRKRQKERLPHVLLTTPESLCLLLSRPDCREVFSEIEALIIDEWHELLISKRGSQTELAAARLRTLSPRMRTWALSATLSNAQDAAQCVVGTHGEPEIIRQDMHRPVTVRTVFPDESSRLPWVGHLGLGMLPAVLKELDPDVPTIIFTNTRSQSERWFSAICVMKPEWTNVMALHHGSIDRKERERVERGLKSGEIRLVVATSSLDLGVDFSPIERVIQIGSPKGVARLLQRAGRSAHRPLAKAEVLCVPTMTMELVEIAASRDAIARGEIEPRYSFERPLDVLAQHMVTCAIGGGFKSDQLFDEVRSAWSFRELTRHEFDLVHAFVAHGGETLRAYPEYHKLSMRDGQWHESSPRVARLHKLNIGTILADTTMDIAYLKGRRLGRIEEDFITHLREGERFVYAGKTLRFVGIKDLTALVTPARGAVNKTPIWAGTKLPISESLAASVRRSIARMAEGRFDTPELEAFREAATIQSQVSILPREHDLLIELTQTREGRHCSILAFEGRFVNSAIGAILALRLARRSPTTFSVTANDYGVELLTSSDIDLSRYITPELFDSTNLVDDAFSSVRYSELAKVQFREIARVSGLVVQNYPGTKKSGRMVGASSTLIFDVLSEFDPEHVLIKQAYREVLERQFERSRLARTLERLRHATLMVRHTVSPTPLSFPIFVERMAAHVSVETIEERIARMQEQWRMNPQRS